MGGYCNDLKKDFQNIFKHGKKAVNEFLNDKSKKYYDRDDNFKGEGKMGAYGYRHHPFYTPFAKCKSPWAILLYPKCCVGLVLLLTLLFFGVSLYGLVIIILLTVILIII